MASWIGLEILIPKHPWKSKIGLLQPILAAKRYVTFFLGHPVCFQPGPRGGGGEENDYNDNPGRGVRANYITDEAPEEAYEDQYDYEGDNYGEVRVQHPTKHYYGGKYDDWE